MAAFGRTMTSYEVHVQANPMWAESVVVTTARIDPNRPPKTAELGVRR